MMTAVEGDELDPKVEEKFLKSIHAIYPQPNPICRIDIFNFYIKKKAFAIVMAGETAKCGNIILKNGVPSIL